jgi:hypothetical protein
MAARPLSDPGARLGVVTRDHVPLIPCSTSWSWLPLEVSMSEPTAHVEPSAAVAEAKGSFSLVPAFGLVWMDRALGAPAAT